MEIFCTINELGEVGWQCIRTLVIMCPKVVLWAPSANYLEYWRKGNPLLPSSDELLWYIQKGFVQYRAREWWLRNYDRRKKHRWPFAKWMESFDQAILDIWREDQRKGMTGALSARVVVASPETGLDWAKEQIALGHVDYKTMLSKIDNDTLLKGYQEKVARARSKKDAAISLLRDAKNDGQAFSESGTNRMLGMPVERQLFSIFSSVVKDIPFNRNIKLADRNPESVVSSINNLMELLNQAGKPAQSQEEAFERMKKILADGDELNDIREWVEQADYLARGTLPEDLTDALFNQIIESLKKGAEKHTLAEYIVPTKNVDRISWLCGLIALMGSIKTPDPWLPIGLVPLLIPTFKGVLQWLGLVKDDYRGPNWPLYVAEGVDNPGRKRRERLIKEAIKLH